ncbi:hypothetical protein SCHPADRAFT_998378 [Schizopora paradoxa]|uniref:DUF7918 domain-containing protein n=1 Tax=Schizopora paradoxa TaxID=27342 RepID=A0A0H2RKD3_9AGAM|nr:hypothetical protein SCHPADRAFT_998378 [Schizopora paradoxa]
MPGLPPFAVKIVVDDGTLEEYEVTRKDNAYSCWVASEEGKNFSIQLDVEATNQPYSCDVFMDGTFVKSCSCRPSLKFRSHKIRGCTIDSSTVRLFAFSRVSLTDDDAIASADQQLPKLGTIEAKIYRTRILGRVDRVFGQPAISNGSVIHERSKKMSMHNVTLQGEIQTAPKKKVTRSQRLDKEPCASFLFTYRPKDFLVAQGIIPSSMAGDNSCDDEPGPSHSASQPTKKRRRSEDASSGKVKDRRIVNNDEDVSEENVRHLKQTLRDVQAKLDAIERRKLPHPVKKEIKLERLALSADIDGVIDLTND